MIRAGDIAKGTFLLIKNEPCEVVEREFFNPGKGSALVRLKMKNLKTGQLLTQNTKTQDSLEDAQVETLYCQYMYADDQSYHFMDNKSFDQLEVQRKGLEDKIYYLKAGETFQVVTWENRPLDILIPYKMVFEVKEAHNAIKGDTVSGSTKPVTIETGLVVKVPLFIKQGDKIRINTETKEYVERANE
jgi:elongation factor P